MAICAMGVAGIPLLAKPGTPFDCTLSNIQFWQHRPEVGHPVLLCLVALLSAEAKAESCAKVDGQSWIPDHLVVAAVQGVFDVCVHRYV